MKIGCFAPGWIGLKFGGFVSCGPLAPAGGGALRYCDEEAAFGGLDHGCCRLKFPCGYDCFCCGPGGLGSIRGLFGGMPPTCVDDVLADDGGGCMYIRVEDDDEEECTKDCRLPVNGVTGALVCGALMLCRYDRCALDGCEPENCGWCGYFGGGC